MSHAWHNGIQMDSKISNKFPIIHGQWAVQIPDFSLIQVKQSKKTMVITWNSLKTWNSLPGFSFMNFCPTHVFLWHMELCLEDRVESVCFSLWGSLSVNDVFEVLKFLKWEFTSEWPRQQNIGHGPFLSLKQQAKSSWLYNFLAISIWNVFVKWIIMIHLTFFRSHLFKFLFNDDQDNKINYAWRNGGFTGWHFCSDRN